MARVLIIGYGNPLRGDDGVGWHAARRLAKLLPGPDVRIETSHQLTPEMADQIGQATLVIFVDAACDNEAGEIKSRRVIPERSPFERFSHHLTPEVLLGLAHKLNGGGPEAVLWSVGAASFEYGETLSPAVEAALPALLEHIYSASRMGLQPCPANT